MSATSAAKLYTPEILGLATELARYPLGEDFPLRAEVRSRTCGSSLKIGLALREDGAIDRIGMQVSACAIGQAAAAIFAQDCKGRSFDDLQTSLAALEDWLSGSGSPPNWKGLSILEPAKAHTGRHGAILLPWRAAVEALSKD